MPIDDNYFQDYSGDGQDYNAVLADSVICAANLLNLLDQVAADRDPLAAERYHINTVLELGAATGLLLQQFHTLGVPGLGVEAAGWPKAHAVPAMLPCMLWGPWPRVGRLLADRAFDLVYDTVSYYATSKAEAARSLKAAYRVAAKATIVVTLDPDEVGRRVDPGTHQRILAISTWKRLLREVGYTYVEATDFIEGSAIWSMLYALKG